MPQNRMSRLLSTESGYYNWRYGSERMTKMDGKIQIFNAYHKIAPVYTADCLTPIQVGCANSKFDLHMLRDDTGDNISALNGDCCELTAQYWVWKNYLPVHDDVGWVGFCHYRRYLNFWKKSKAESSMATFDAIDKDDFRTNILPRYNDREIHSAIPRECGIVLPKSYSIPDGKTMLEWYMMGMHGYGLDDALSVIKKQFPDYIEDLVCAASMRKEYRCLTYLMRRDVFERYASWLFPFLESVRKLWCKLPEYRRNGRQEGLVAEHLFMIWLCHESRVFGTKVAECDGVLLEVPSSEMHVGLLRKAFERLKLRAAWIKASIKARRFLGKCR